MYARQDGKCAICEAPDEGGKMGLHVDHDHETGKVRALLCAHCNQGLGKFRDDPSLLRVAADYIESYLKPDRSL